MFAQSLNQCVSQFDGFVCVCVQTLNALEKKKKKGYPDSLLVDVATVTVDTAGPGVAGCV